jgi:hypothetical protein
MAALSPRTKGPSNKSATAVLLRSSFGGILASGNKKFPHPFYTVYVKLGILAYITGEV